MADENPQGSAKLYIVDYDRQFFSNTLTDDLAFFINSERKMLIGPYNKSNPSILELTKTYAKVSGALQVTDTLYTKRVNSESGTMDILNTSTANINSAHTVYVQASNMTTSRLDTSVLLSASNLFETVTTSNMTTNTMNCLENAYFKNSYLSNVFIDQSTLSNAYIASGFVNNLGTSNIDASDIKINSNLSVQGVSSFQNDITACNIEIMGQLSINNFIGFSTDDIKLNSNLNHENNNTNKELQFMWGNYDNDGLLFTKTLAGGLKISSSFTENDLVHLTKEGLLTTPSINTRDMTVEGILTLYNEINSVSDIREKTNIKRLENVLEKLDKVHGYTFSMKRDQTKKERIGVLAQEIMPYFPESVYQTQDGLYSVSYPGLIGILIESIHELKKRVEYLEKQI